MQLGFGSGVLWGTPTSDANGNAIVNPTPSQLGVLQDASIDISFDTKMLYGNQQFPVGLGRGKGKIAVKSKLAQINGRMVADLMFGQSNTSSIYAAVYDTAGAPIPGTPFQITPTVPGGGTWAADLGVRNAGGVPMTRVAAAPATGQYSVAGGVYTFAAADTGLQMFISYQYSATSTAAKKLQVLNLPMGYAPTFRADILVPFQGKNLLITLPNCIANKLSLATKQDDFLIPEFDLDGFADAAGNVIYIGTSE